MQPVKIEYQESPRLRRIRFVAQLLDQSIVLPGGYRIGIDPIIGLIPGIGDTIGAVFSFYIVYEAARLGISTGILLRMCGNIFLETFLGEIPLLGDIFDAVWKATVRNVRLIDLHHRPTMPERPARKIFLFVAVLFLAVAMAGLLAFAGIIWLVWTLLKS